MTTNVLFVGDALRAYGGTKINRPAVVLRLLDVDGVRYAFVALGTSQPPKTGEARFIFLDASIPGYDAMGLTKPTWFIAGKTCRIKESDDSITIVGKCPPQLLIDLLRLQGVSQ